jgi:hypothetical protein
MSSPSEGEQLETEAELRKRVLASRRAFRKMKLNMSFLQGFTNYISDEAAEKLKLYKYSGGDNGIVYRYFYNPLALKLVEHLPETLA